MQLHVTLQSRHVRHGDCRASAVQQSREPGGGICNCMVGFTAWHCSAQHSTKRPKLRNPSTAFVSLLLLPLGGPILTSCTSAPFDTTCCNVTSEKPRWKLSETENKIALTALTLLPHKPGSGQLGPPKSADPAPETGPSCLASGRSATAEILAEAAAEEFGLQLLH